MTPHTAIDPAPNRDTVPVFVIGSGRSGTRTIFKLLSGIEGLEIHHEFCCTHVQPVAALYAMGRIGIDEVTDEMRSLHGAAIDLSDADTWIDCSNKLTWVVEPLLRLHPGARFVNLIRDGRKVANSYFHKLPDEMYDDRSTAILRRWLDAPDGTPKPPPEKKYWWNIPIDGMPFAEEFPDFDQFQRTAYHWVESNRVAAESLAEHVPPDRQLTLRLEDLVSEPSSLAAFCDFVGVPCEDSYAEYLKTPQNVIYPMDFGLSDDQRFQFAEIAAPMMRQLGYDIDAKEYTVVY